MEQINPYAVTRNTATFEAYRAYTRETYKAGQPFTTLAIMLTALGPAFATAVTRYGLHQSPTDEFWPFACLVLSFALGPLCFGVAFWQMARYRREHPVPEEWRQIPRLSRPLVAGRRPRLP